MQTAFLELPVLTGHNQLCLPNNPTSIMIPLFISIKVVGCVLLFEHRWPKHTLPGTGKSILVFTGVVLVPNVH